MTDKKDEVKKDNIVAKKDFLIVQNSERYDIKEGDDIIELKVPKKFYANLKTENII
jgi:hypothetical protein